jgi:hypothetical protein
MINLKDIHSLSDRQRNPCEHDQKLLELAVHASAIVGIQRGLQGMYQGTGQDAEDAFASLERELGITQET